jgi:hypothetical protein
MFLRYRRTLYHSREVLSLLLFIALGILVPLLLFVVIAISILISLIVSLRFRFSVIMYLLFTSPIPLSKGQEGDLNFLLTLDTCNMCTQNKIFIQKSLRLVLQR